MMTYGDNIDDSVKRSEGKYSQNDESTHEQSTLRGASFTPKRRNFQTNFQEEPSKTTYHSNDDIRLQTAKMILIPRSLVS